MLISKRSRLSGQMFLLYTLLVSAIYVNAQKENEAHTSKDYKTDVGSYLSKLLPKERQLLSYRKNGIRVDVKVVPTSRTESATEEVNDHFPEFPARDIGRCIINLSLGCVKHRFVQFLDTIGHLDKITLLGEDVKLVKTRVVRNDGRSVSNDIGENIERSINDFFDSFILRITLPRWNGKREKNQIDVMLDDVSVVEGL